MNRFLVIVVLVLIPITFVTYNKDTESVMYGSTLESTSLEIPIPIQDNNTKVVEDEKQVQVLISNNQNKSNPFYVDLEEYIVGVVSGEMPASFNEEALKAQAVAARTYALYKMRNIKNYVLSTTVNDQVYLSQEAMKKKWGNDYSLYYNRVRQAVEDTKGQVLTYNGDLIISYYFAISNGYTDSAKVVFNEDRDYLVSVDSSWDKDFRPYFSSRSLTRTTFCTKLNIDCSNIVIGNATRSENHYVREITINNTKFTGLEIFNKLNLKSRDFTIKLDGDNVIIDTLGFGHAVGMSQYGAEGMARAGYKYQDILNHYYKNTQITNI